MAKKDSLQQTLIVAFLLCLVCSVVVSTAAVMLRPAQEANQELDFKRNILVAAGLMEEGRSVEELFSQITTRAVDLESGRFTDEIDPATYDTDQALKDSALSDALSNDDDLAKINRREKYALVYLVENDSGIEQIILPVRGYGLWSTLYGFIALQSDANTVNGLVFYEHGETPGLGGEVDNPRWRSLWGGKEVYNDSGEVAIEVIKGSVNAASPRAMHQVDGLAGATLTSRGVSDLVRFWLDQDGFKPFLDNLRAGEI